MTTLSRDEVVKMAREAGAVFDPQWGIASNTGTATFERFAALCRAPLVAEVERLEQWHAEMADNRNAIASERDTLKAELARVRAVPVPKDWRDAVQEFVTRCESGEVRSKFIEACFEKLRGGVGLPEPDVRIHRGFATHSTKQLLAYGAAQRLAGREQALKEATDLDWTAIMCEGRLVTWENAETLGCHAVEHIRALAASPQEQK